MNTGTGSTTTILATHIEFWIVPRDDVRNQFPHVILIDALRSTLLNERCSIQNCYRQFPVLADNSQALQLL
jgi:hypothetical protein